MTDTSAIALVTALRAFAVGVAGCVPLSAEAEKGRADLVASSGQWLKWKGADFV